MVLAAGSGFLSAVILFVDRAPSALFGLFLGNAFVAIAFFDVFGLTFLFVGVGLFFAAGNVRTPYRLHLKGCSGCALGRCTQALPPANNATRGEVKKRPSRR
jgi:hypothetical protein